MIRQLFTQKHTCANPCWGRGGPDSSHRFDGGLHKHSTFLSRKRAAGSETPRTKTVASRTCWVKDHFAVSLDVFSLSLTPLQLLQEEGFCMTRPSPGLSQCCCSCRAWASTTPCTNGLPTLLLLPLPHEVKSLKQYLMKVIIKLYGWGERGSGQGRCSCTLTSASRRPLDSLENSQLLLGRKVKTVIILSVF